MRHPHRRSIRQAAALHSWQDKPELSRTRLPCASAVTWWQTPGVLPENARPVSALHYAREASASRPARTQKLTFSWEGSRTGWSGPSGCIPVIFLCSIGHSLQSGAACAARGVRNGAPSGDRLAGEVRLRGPGAGRARPPSRARYGRSSPGRAARAAGAAQGTGQRVGVGGGRQAREAHCPAHRRALGRWCSLTPALWCDALGGERWSSVTSWLPIEHHQPSLSPSRKWAPTRCASLRLCAPQERHL